MITSNISAAEYDRIRLWIKTHLALISRTEDLDDYMKAFAWLDNHRPAEVTVEAEIEVHGGVGWVKRGTSVIDVPDDWQDGDKIIIQIRRKED